MRSLTGKVILILLLSSALAFSQDFNFYAFSMIDYSLIGSGARARGMGGAFTGVSDDASALTWNPAGLIQVDKTQASALGLYLPLEQKTALSFTGGNPAAFSGKFKDDKLKLGYASFVAPIRIKGHPFMASATYQSVQDQVDDQYNWADLLYYYQIESTIGFGVATLGSRTTTVGSLDQISLGFGTGLYGDISVGAAVNIYTGSWSSSYQGVLVDTIPYFFAGRLIDSVRFKYATNVFDKADSKGIDFTVSLLYRKDKLRAGAVLKTPFEVITDHDLVRADTVYQKSIRIASEGPGTAIKPTLFRGKTKLQIPITVAVGGSYQVTPKFLIAADAEYKRFSSSKYFIRSEKKPENSLDSINLLTLPGSIYYTDTSQTSYYNSAGELIEIYNQFKPEFENSMQFRLGAEYMAKTTVGMIPVRGGIRLIQEPYRDVDSVYRDVFAQPQKGFKLGNKVVRTVIALGTGIHWKQIWLDFAVELNNEKQTETGQNALGSYSSERKRSGPAYFFNFTGFF